MKNNLLMAFRHSGRLIAAGLVFFLVACDDKGPATEKAAAPAESKAVADMKQGSDNTSVLGGKMSVRLPEGYRKMDRKMLAETYGHVPEHQRPTEVWYRETDEGRVMLGFARTSEKVRESQFAELLTMMEKQLVSVSPRVTQTVVNGKKVYRLETTSSFTIPGKGNVDIVTVLQPRVLDDRLLFTTFSYPAIQKEKYAKEAEAILSSLKS